MCWRLECPRLRFLSLACDRDCTLSPPAPRHWWVCSPRTSFPRTWATLKDRQRSSLGRANAGSAHNLRVVHGRGCRGWVGRGAHWLGTGCRRADGGGVADFSIAVLMEAASAAAAKLPSLSPLLGSPSDGQLWRQWPSHWREELRT